MKNQNIQNQNDSNAFNLGTIPRCPDCNLIPSIKFEFIKEN